MPVVGLLMSSTGTRPAFHQGLSQVGYDWGQNVAFDYRNAGGGITIRYRPESIGIRKTLLPESADILATEWNGSLHHDEVSFSQDLASYWYFLRSFSSHRLLLKRPQSQALPSTISKRR